MTIKIIIGVLVALGIFVFVARKTPSTIRVERTFNAPVEKVWQIWTDVESMKKWWSPKDYTAPVIKSDLQVSGKFLYSMQSPKGEMFWNTGQYVQVVPNKKIVLLMSFSDENGKVIRGKEIPVPGVWPDAIRVSVDFEDVGGKTRVLVEEVGIPTIMKVFAKMGWEQQFDKFETLLNEDTA